MQRVADNALGAGLGVSENWVVFALVGLKWSIFVAALWVVLVPLKHCLSCALGGDLLAGALPVATVVTLIFAFLAVDRALAKRKRRVSH